MQVRFWKHSSYENPPKKTQHKHKQKHKQKTQTQTKDTNKNKNKNKEHKQRTQTKTIKNTRQTDKQKFEMPAAKCWKKVMQIVHTKKNTQHTHRHSKDVTHKKRKKTVSHFYNKHKKGIKT